jgi:hypothetical protein
MCAMSEGLVVQGRRLIAEDVLHIRQLIANNAGWSRRRLSEVLCAEWNWRNGSGRFKDMATRTLLVKLEARGVIKLPARRRPASNRMASRQMQPRLWDSTPVCGTLKTVGPLTVREVSTDPGARAEFAAALAQFHYLGYRGSVGENLQYTVTDQSGRLLACLLFGSAAWKCKPRDQFVGWNPEQRERNLYLLTNNTRFLILPQVRVAHLSSWILGHVLRRLSADWREKYGHPIVLVETFVEQQRFAGTSYKASNWIRLGSTTGRSRQDRQRTLQVPVKEVYLYPLHRGFRKELSA